MADVRRLDGSPVEVEHVGRDEKVAALLDHLVKKNEQGRISALAFVFITPEGRYDSCWQWPADTQGFPWGIALQGALSQLHADLAAGVIDVPVIEGSEIDPDTDPAA